MSKTTQIVQQNETAIATTDAAQVLDIVSRAASDPSVDIDKLERLLQMHERISAKNAETAFNQAMTEAQAGMRRISADARNPQTHSQYASYAALDRALRPIYTGAGFALSFDTGDAPQPEYVRVLCHVSHNGGFSKTYRADMPADGKGAKGGDVMTKTHAAGSAMSYGMRYLLKMIFNVAIGEDDDDGNSASEPTITEKQVADIEALIDEVGANTTAFLKTCKIPSLEMLPASKFAGAVKRLEAKRAG